jgi:apolipoprotein N-acyltransferase
LTTRSADYALAAASGVLLALSFPTFGHPACGWVALAPLMIALQRGTLQRAFVLGVIAGGIYFTGTLYWLTRVMAVYGALAPWVAVLVNVALIAFLALFPAAFAVSLRRLIAAFGPRALLAAPFIWVTVELGRTHLFSGFPWVLLGYSQTTVLPVAQLASVFGVFGLSALVASVSAATAIAVVGLEGRGSRDGLRRYIPLLTVFALVLGVTAWGSRRVARAEWTQAGVPIKVGLIQGNVDQAEKWDSARASSIFSDYLRMTRHAIAEGAELVIWPESSTPFLFGEEGDRKATELVRTVAKQANVPILLGSNQIQYGSPNVYFNAAFLVNPDGTTGGVYRKMHLVPFGEYVPLKRLFFFASRLVENAGDFSPGTSPVMLPINGHLVSTAICYEIVYPALIRQSVRRGSELLTTITNDAWFGPTSAPVQHFEQAAMRAIEDGRYLVRAANTGISGIVDPYGRVLAASRIYEPAVMVGDVRLLRVSTLYTRIGDLLAYASAVLTFLLLLQSRIWRQSTT